MQWTMPYLEVEGDTTNVPASRIMARSGEMLGATKTRAVWRFGFIEGSDLANAFGVFRKNFLFVLADENGKILDKFEGFALELPKRFKNIINGKVYTDTRSKYLGGISQR